MGTIRGTRNEWTISYPMGVIYCGASVAELKEMVKNIQIECQESS